MHYATLLNFSDGGANMKNMRGDWYINEGERVIQMIQTMAERH